jgi:hypothetical protein
VRTLTPLLSSNSYSPAAFARSYYPTAPGAVLLLCHYVVVPFLCSVLRSVVMWSCRFVVLLCRCVVSQSRRFVVTLFCGHAVLDRIVLLLSCFVLVLFRVVAAANVVGDLVLSLWKG